ncbi:MAG: response regulator [Polyangiales bacterium]
MTEHQSDHPSEDQDAFLKSAPRRVIEIKAALGALIADPDSQRMRDEFGRRVAAFLAGAQLHERGSLADGLLLLRDQLDAIRALSTVSKPHLDRFAGLVASLNGRLELDARASHEPPVEASGAASLLPGAEAHFPGIESLTRRAASQASPLAMGPAIGTAPLPGAAPQLVLGVAPSRVHALLETLPGDIEVHVVVDREEAVERARATSAELVIVESGAPFDGLGVVASLGASRTTDFIPVALLAAPEEPVAELRARCPSAVEVLPDDCEADAIQALIVRVLRGGNSIAPAPLSDLRDATVGELAQALQDEIRRGLVDALDPSGRDARVSLGEGSEVLAAAWRAISSIRDLVEHRSNGAIRFEVPVSPRGLSGAEVLSVGVDATDEAAWTQPGEDPLPGRRALVVDDDPKVTAQFAQTLRAVGMTVFTRPDGRSALEAARALSPDVILTDILMPGMDGFSLCRAVRRDVLLRHTPVILLSWREDLLVRMRELGAQAQGYLRKEARLEAVIARVRATLRLRARTQRRIAELPWGAQVRGRVERVGLPTILEAAAGLGDAAVTVADSVSVTEVELRGGRFVSAARTQQDGAMVRGEEALARAVAAPAARFGVRRSSAAVRANLDGGVSELLRATARRVAALEDAVSGAGLLQVHRVRFDADVAEGYARALPLAMRSLVTRLLAGDSPRDLVLRDGVSPAELEPLLVELARRGAVREVRDRDGCDLAALRLSVPESVAPPPDEEAVGVLSPGAPAAGPAATDSTDDDLELSLGQSLADAVFRQLTQAVSAREVASSPPPPSPSPLRASTPSFGTPEGFVSRDQSRIEPMQILPLAAKLFDSAPPPPAEQDEVAEREFDPILASVRPPPKAPDTTPIRADLSLAELLEPEDPAVPPPPKSPIPRSPRKGDGDSARAQGLSETAESEAPEPEVTEPKAPEPEVTEPKAPEPKAPEPEATEPEAPEPEATEPEAPEPSKAAIVSQPPSSHAHYARPLQAPPDDADGEPDVGRSLRLLALVVVAAVVSYLAVRVFFVRRGDVSLEAPTSVPVSELPGVQVDAGEPARLDDAGAGYVEPAPFLDGGALAEGMGLLVVPRPRAGSPRVDIVVESVGRFTAPASIPLSEGVYRVRFETGRIRSTQFVTARRGWAQVRQPPSEQ